MAIRSNPVSGPPRSPIERQLNYIDALLEQRLVEPWMYEQDPETIEEASKLIEALQECDYKESLDYGKWTR